MAPASCGGSGTGRARNEPAGWGVRVGMAPLTTLLPAGIALGVLALGLVACGPSGPGEPATWSGSPPSVGRTGSPSAGGTEPSPTPSSSSSTSTGRRVPGSPGGSPSKGSRVTLSGIPEAGVEAGCLLLQGYLLVGGDPGLLESGAPVTVVGHTDPDVASYCQQGTVLVVDAASPAT